MIPLATSPLGKAIRTSEGQLVAAVTAITTVTAGFDPSTLPRKEAAIVVGALAAVHSVSRTVLKAVAVLKGVGLDPIAPATGGSLVSKGEAEARQVLGKVQADYAKLLVKVKALEETPAVAELVSDAVELASPPPPVALASLPPEAVVTPPPAQAATVPDPAVQAAAADLAARQQAAAVAGQPIPTV